MKLDEDYNDGEPSTKLGEAEQQADIRQHPNLSTSDVFVSAEADTSERIRSLRQDWEYLGTNTIEEHEWQLALQQELIGPGEADSRLHHGHATIDDDAYLISAPGATTYVKVPASELNYQLDPYEVPPYEVASRLLRHYMKTVHKWLPILPLDFENQIRIFYETPHAVPDNWLATMNLVFAIGAHHALLVIGSEDVGGGKGKAREDAPYLSRALQLLRDKELLLWTTTPELSLIQVGTLSCL